MRGAAKVEVGVGTRLTILLWPLRMVERVARRVGRRIFTPEGAPAAAAPGAGGHPPNTPDWRPPRAAPTPADDATPAHIPPTEGDMSERLTMGQLTLREHLEAGDDIVLLDVREPHEVDQGQIPGAVHIPLAYVASRFQQLDPGHTIVAYCASGQRSADAARTLRALGFSKVHSLAGGFARWVRDGGAVSRPGDGAPEAP